MFFSKDRKGSDDESDLNLRNPIIILLLQSNKKFFLKIEDVNAVHVISSIH